MDQMAYNYDVCAGQYDELGLIDFLDEANLEQFIDLIRGHEAEDQPAPAHEFCVNWDCDHVVFGCPQFVPIEPENIPNLHDLCEFNSIVSDQNVSHDLHQNVNVVDEAQQPSKEKPLQPQASNPTKHKTKKSDRARTLISERKRRSSMKEKLYALRSLVPYITKMDKASIIADAIRYVKELQMKSNKLKSEIADLESPFNQLPAPEALPANVTIISPPIKQILQIEVFEVEARDFYVRIVCNKSQGIAALLYNALDSIGLNVQNSNLATTDDQNYLFTFTLNVARDCEMDINLSDMKLWIASAFCNQGFHFSTLRS